MERMYVRQCATFNEETDECFIKDTRCPQLDNNRICCKYFRDYVAPGIRIERRSEMKTKPCADCGKMFTQEKPRQRFCPSCKEQRDKARKSRYNEKVRA